MLFFDKLACCFSEVCGLSGVSLDVGGVGNLNDEIYRVKGEGMLFAIKM